MESKNQKTVDYFNNMSNKLNRYANFDKNLGEDLMDKGIRLAKTSKGARINARVDAIMSGKEFDESGTPPEELETANDDVIQELVKREIDNIFGE